MADSLTLKGAKHVINQTGDEMTLVRPTRGGDTHKVPRWWALKGSVNYTAAAIFNVETSVGDLALVVPVDAESVVLDIYSAGDGNFTFGVRRGVDRVAVMAADLSTFYVEYQFAKISGGPVLKRTVNALPDEISEDPISFQGGTTIDGVPTVGETLTANAANFTGGVGNVSTNLVFQISDTGSGGWNFLAGNPNIISGGVAFYVIKAAEEGKFIRASYQVTDDNEMKSSNSSSTSVIAATFAARAAAANFSYVVTVDSGEYELDGVANAGVAGSAGDTFAFDLSDASLSGHPFKIYTDSTKTTEVTVGVEQEGDTLLFTPPIAGTFSYQCANHEGMGGTITIA